MTVEVTVWAYAVFSGDYLDLFSAPDASSPVCTYLTTLNPTQGGTNILSGTFVLPEGRIQAVREYIDSLYLQRQMID